MEYTVIWVAGAEVCTPGTVNFDKLVQGSCRAHVHELCAQPLNPCTAKPLLQLCQRNTRNSTPHVLQPWHYME